MKLYVPPMRLYVPLMGLYSPLVSSYYVPPGVTSLTPWACVHVHSVRGHCLRCYRPFSMYCFNTTSALCITDIQPYLFRVLLAIFRGFAQSSEV